MPARNRLARSLAAILLIPSLLWAPATACCPAAPSGKPVVNADQTVIMIWDAATKTQHFIRQATFKSAAEDFGFLVPTPAAPELEESGDEAFPFLQKLTEPARERISRSRGMSCGCSKPAPVAAAADVTVVEEKLVAGFHAVVLQADSANALVSWLKDHGYAYSPEIEAWARPYVEANWNITALKVAKDSGDEAVKVAASALRISFQTDRPLFPYREPDSRDSAEALGARDRLLRIYFLADARYAGGLEGDATWSGKVAWANKLSAADRAKTLELLKLPETTGPTEFWLTEFEDQWPYQVAASDLYFARGSDQSPIARDPIVEYASSSWSTEIVFVALVTALIFTPPLRRFRSLHRPAALATIS